MSVAFEDMSKYAQHVVKALDLEAHPEGGWYRQTWLSLQAASGTATKQAAERGDTQRGVSADLTSADSDNIGTEPPKSASNGTGTRTKDTSGASVTSTTSADPGDRGISHSDNAYAATVADLKSMKATEGRPLASLIYFLLAEGDASAWHKVDATEIWLWHGPATVGLELGGYGNAPADESGRMLYKLGQGITSASSTSDGTTSAAVPIGQVVIPEGCWQRTVPGKGDALVSCVVSPGFTFDGFTLE
ncbi:cupin domain-containing protein [Bifidobacterium sp. ESL0745]|nr:cupin domain-containing protein [Bifidobacterium sp. ESL0745]MDF7665432.1 cupin domain-containing protein [Bifidobacterium sp. ESL0745]